MLGHDLTFNCNAPLASDVSDIVVGIRPEFIRLEEGSLSGTVYTTLPSGMETTVKLKVGDEMVTSVVFGSVDFSHSRAMSFSITGSGILLFDGGSGDLISMGSLSGS